MVKTLFRWRHLAAGSLAASLVFLSLSPARTAMINDFVSTIALTARLDIVLPFEADMALVLPDGQLVLAAKRRAGAEVGGSLTVYNPQTREAGLAVDLPHDVSLIERNSTTGLIHAAGNAGEAFHVTRLNVESGIVSAYIQAGTIEYPSLAISDNGTVYLASRANTSVSIIAPERFLHPEKAKAEFAANGDGFVTGLRYTGPGNVAGLAVSGDGSVLFVSDSNEGRLSALDVNGKQTIVDQLGYGDAKDAQSLPLVVRAQSSSAKEPRSALIAADARRSRLLLADYNPSFQALDPVSEVSFRLAAPPSVQDGAGSPLLVDTSADQSVIVLASRTGRGLRVYGRNGTSIEAGPEFADLADAPLSLDVADNGRLAALMLSDRKTVSLLREDSAVTVEPQTEAIRALQRQLTELGYPIGVVDGILGAKTNRALQRALQVPGTTQVDLLDVDAMSASEILDLTNQLKLSPNVQQLR